MTYSIDEDLKSKANLFGAALRPPSSLKINPLGESQSNMGQEEEVIIFSGFLSDYDPTLILVLTYSHKADVSYLKVLKIEKVT